MNEVKNAIPSGTLSTPLICICHSLSRNSAWYTFHHLSFPCGNTEARRPKTHVDIINQCTTQPKSTNRKFHWDQNDKRDIKHEVCYSRIRQFQKSAAIVVLGIARVNSQSYVVLKQIARIPLVRLTRKLGGIFRNANRNSRSM